MYKQNLILTELIKWYLVGLIASDGCLDKKNKRVEITLKDYEFFDKLKRLINIPNKIGTRIFKSGEKAHYIRISDKSFYDFLLSVGLTPTKSFTIGELKIPDEYFGDFLRGEIDGDGSIGKYIKKGSNNIHWTLRIYSASDLFISWIHKKIEELYGIRGKKYIRKANGNRKELFILEYGKISAQKLLKIIYYENAFALDRKMKSAQECIATPNRWINFYKSNLNGDVA